MDITPLWTTIVGAVSAIAGGFAANFLTQTMINRAEKRKRMREKIEEIYELTYRIKTRVRVQLSKVEQIKSIKGIRVDDFGGYCEPAYAAAKAPDGCTKIRERLRLPRDPSKSLGSLSRSDDSI